MPPRSMQWTESCFSFATTRVMAVAAVYPIIINRLADPIREASAQSDLPLSPDNRSSLEEAKAR